jgi:hypothetical protein
MRYHAIFIAQAINESKVYLMYDFLVNQSRVSPPATRRGLYLCSTVPRVGRSRTLETPVLLFLIWVADLRSAIVVSSPQVSACRDIVYAVVFRQLPDALTPAAAGVAYTFIEFALALFLRSLDVNVELKPPHSAG